MFRDTLSIEKRKVSCSCYLSKTHFVQDFLQNSIGNSSTSTTCNPIYIKGTILMLQLTMQFHQQLIHQHLLQPHLQCGNDPTVTNKQWNSVKHTCTKNSWYPIYNAEQIREWSAHVPRMIRPNARPSRNRRNAEVDHRGLGTHFCVEKHRLSCVYYLSKTHFVRDVFQKSISNSSTSTTCNPIYSEETILVADHNAIRSATRPPVPLTTPFTMRGGSCSCKSQWNSVDHIHTKNSWSPIYNAKPIRQWSAHDPTTRETVSQPRTAMVDHRGSRTHCVWKT